MIGKKVLTKIVLLLIVLFGVTILTFVYTNLSPVDAAEALAVRRYSRPTAEQIELVREELGLDKPILQQYGSWLWNALHGDFGNSYNTGRSIVEELTASIQPTLIMAVLALLFSTVICIPLGVLSASRKGGLADKSIYLFGIICMSLPNYWIGFMLLLAFAVYLPIFSIMGADSLKDFVLPALALASPQALIGLAMMLIVFLVMVFAPFLAPNDPMQLNVAHSFAPPDTQYPLGTDELGRCVLSRLIYGARESLSIALPTLLLLAIISTVIATLCAYLGGIVDRVFEVVSNIFMAFPPFLVAITLVGLFESKVL